jgi:hypothetical protein
VLQDVDGGNRGVSTEDGSHSPVKSLGKAVKRRQGLCESSHDQGERGLHSLARTLDYVCEDAKGSGCESLWHSKQERLAWLQEVQAARSVCTVSYLLRCLRFALREHLA